MSVGSTDDSDTLVDDSLPAALRAQQPRIAGVVASDQIEVAVRVGHSVKMISDRRSPPVALGTEAFRNAATDAYFRGDAITSPMQLDDGLTWGVLAFLCVMVFGALAITVLGKVELSGSGRAVLRSNEGVLAIAALTGGVVERVHVEAGSRVKRGELLVSIDASELRAQLMEAERALEATRAFHEQEEQEGASLFEEGLGLLERRAKLATRRMGAQHAEVTRLRVTETELTELGARGVIAKTDGERAHASTAEGEQDRMSLEDVLVDTRSRITLLRRERAERMATRRHELRAAEAQLAAVRLRMSQTVVVAPSDGIVETMLARAGERVEAGKVVLHLGPKDTPTSVVAFLPERSQAFLRDGVTARLEVDRLPVGEFGSLPARVVRVGRELAPSQEVERIIGVGDIHEPLVRIDLTLVDSPQRRRLSAYLRSGTLMTARVPLRRRPIIGLILDPVRRWLDS